MKAFNFICKISGDNIAHYRVEGRKKDNRPAPTVSAEYNNDLPINK